MTDARRLEISWEDPAPLAARSREMSGLDFLRAVRDGDVSPAPITQLLGFALVEVDDGRAVFSAVPGEQHYNPIGVVHAGLVATMLDSAMGVAVHSTLPAGMAYTTLETKFNLVRPLTADTGEIRCEGTVVHPGSRVATADGRVVRASDGKLVAHGTSTCLVFPLD
jgi:uncharacterized protein (TIGR00369 family)